MNLRPLNDNILVKEIEEKETTASGIVLPDSVSNKEYKKGEVVAVGPGRRNDSGIPCSIELKTGDAILYAKFGPLDVTFEGQKLHLIKEHDVIAVLEG